VEGRRNRADTGLRSDSKGAVRAPHFFRSGQTAGQVYKKLFKAFGPQGWWPVSPAPGELPAYRPLFYGPHSGAAMFEICAGAILTQNTAWTNARAALDGLSSARALSPSTLAALPLAGLCGLIRPSGYYRQKAARLKEFSRYILARHPEGLGKWFSDADTEKLRAELLMLKGIGPETADSMMLYASGKAKFVVDAYTFRIFGRLGLLSGTYSDLQLAFERSLPHDHRIYNEYHALIVALCKNCCRKTKPLCGACPLKAMCIGYKNAQDDTVV